MQHFASNFLVQKSKILCVWIVSIHALAVLALCCAELPLIAYPIILAPLVFSCWVNWKKYILLTHSDSIKMLRYLEDNNWKLEFLGGKNCVVHLNPAKSYITSYWLILTFFADDSKKKYALVLFSDCFTTKQIYKQLRRIVFEIKLALLKKKQAHHV